MSAVRIACGILFSGIEQLAHVCRLSPYTSQVKHSLCALQLTFVVGLVTRHHWARLVADSLRDAIHCRCGSDRHQQLFQR